MLSQALGHTDHAEASDLAQAAAFDPDLGLQREVRSPDRRSTVTRATGRELSWLFDQLGLQSDNVRLAPQREPPADVLIISRGRIVPDTICCVSDHGADHRQGVEGMGFHVEPGSIRKLSERVDELRSDADVAQAYAESHLAIDGGDARMYATVADAASSASVSLSELYGRLAAIVRTAAVELDTAAAMYAETDQEKAERLDGSYPGGK